MLSGVKDAVSGAKSAVSEIASGASELGSAAGGLASDSVGRGLKSVLDRDVFQLGTITDAARGVAEVLTAQRTMGSAIGGALDKLGLPDWATDLATAAVDTMTGRPDSSIPHVLSATGGIAERAGLDSLSDFLGTAGDVTGMAGDRLRSAAMIYATGSGDPTGLWTSVEASEDAETFQSMARQATDVAQQVDRAVQTREAMEDGDVEAAREGISTLLDANLGTLHDILGERVDAEVMEALQLAVADNDALLGEALEHQVTTEGQDGAMGTQVFDSEPGRQFVDQLVEAGHGDHGSQLKGVDGGTRTVVFEAKLSVEAMLDVASLSVDVALEVSKLLEQTGSMAGATAVSDLVGADMRG